MAKKDFESLITEALDNIREDRKDAKDKLNDLTNWMASAADRHKEVGFTLAKYLEVLQRSNEQLVKIASLKKKKENDDEELSDNDRNDVFEELNKEVKKSIKRDD